MDSQDKNGEQRHGSLHLVSMLERFHGHGVQRQWRFCVHLQ
jgi:hypothetical protein